MSNGNKENEQCKWYVTHTPYGFPVYATECGKMRLSCATGIKVSKQRLDTEMAQMRLSDFM